MNVRNAVGQKRSEIQQALPAFVQIQTFEVPRLEPPGQLTRQEHDGQGHRQVEEGVAVGRLKGFKDWNDWSVRGSRVPTSKKTGSTRNFSLKIFFLKNPKLSKI